MKSIGSMTQTNLVVFTDLDGTLLDHDTYAWEPAAEALQACHRQDVPVVLVSSKTRAEMQVLQEDLGPARPFVSENGGGIFFPPGCPQPPPAEAVPGEEGRVWALGVPYEIVVRALRGLREELGRPDLRGFSDMDVQEIARLTGLALKDARLAARREYDEPLVASHREREDLDLLDRAARKRGLQVTAGGRFLHLFGDCDKGEAVSRLVDWFRRERPGLRSVGLGDGLNDLPMLKRVDVPVLVRGARQVEIQAREIPGLLITEEPGPAGWNRAVLNLLAGCREKPF